MVRILTFLSPTLTCDQTQYLRSGAGWQGRDLVPSLFETIHIYRTSPYERPYSLRKEAGEGDVTRTVEFRDRTLQPECRPCYTAPPLPSSSADKNDPPVECGHLRLTNHVAAKRW